MYRYTPTSHFETITKHSKGDGYQPYTTVQIKVELKVPQTLTCG